MRLKHFNKGVFKNSTLRYWTGKKWEYANLKRWNGTEWESCIETPLNDFFVDTTNKCLVEPNGNLARHYSSTYFTNPYIYYYGNKLSYRIKNNYKNATIPWSMDIEVWNPWTGKLIMTKNIPHPNPDDYNSTKFNSNISITNNKVFIFCTSLDGYWDRKGAHVICLDLNLNKIATSDCTSYDSWSGFEKYLHTLNGDGQSMTTRLDGIDYVTTYGDEEYPTLKHRPIAINYDTGVCRAEFRLETTISSTYNYEKLTKSGLYAKLYRNTGSDSTPIYDWRLSISFEDLVENLAWVYLGNYPSSLFVGGATIKTTIEEFKYGGVQRRLNNTKLFGALLPNYGTNILDGCVITLPLISKDYSETYNRYTRYVEVLSGSDENYLTFRKIWGNPSLGYVVYENMNGINLANKILNYSSASNSMTFRHLPNGQTLLYFDNDIFNFTQKNDKFYISYYGSRVRNFTGTISEPYGCNKEIIE